MERNQPVGAGEIERVLDGRREQFLLTDAPGMHAQPVASDTIGSADEATREGMPVGMHDDGRCGRRGTCHCE